MLFNSFTYITFLLVVVSAFWTLPRTPRLWMLFIASLVFYSFWRWEYTFLVLTTTFIDFFVAQKIHATHDEKKRKRWLALSLTANLGVLFYFKYTIFIVGTLSGFSTLLGHSEISWPWAIILPIGISFYTFQSIAYTVDVYRRYTTPIREIPLYGTFVTFFPQLIAGPILRANEVIPQLSQRASFQSNDIAIGIRMILSGLFLKVVLADNIAPFVDTAFLTPVETLSALDVWVMAFLFGFQIYFDFSAYSHIAIGSARLMGIHFPANFNFPYIANSPREFWKRWHISLSSWIRDYLYLPLAGIRPRDISTGGLSEATEQHTGSTGHRRSMTLALVLTWLLMGLWHGASWTFALWGLWHASLILIYRQITRIGMPKNKLIFLAGWGTTFLATMAGWIPFRAPSIEVALSMLTRLVSPTSYLNFDQIGSGYLWSILPINIDPLNYLLALTLVMGTLLCWAFKQYIWDRQKVQRGLTKAALTCFIAFETFFIFVFLKTTGQFIYFQF